MSEVFCPKESVYNPLTKAELQPPKPPRYTSRFHPMVLQEKKDSIETTRTMRTMGPARVELPSPEKFLKKSSRETKVQEKSLRVGERCTMKKPPVPLRTDVPTMGLQTNRDFVKSAPAAMMTPIKPLPTSVDSNKGHKQLLENSGLVPKYIRKKDYGEVPQYLLQRNQEKLKAQEQFQDFVKEQQDQGAMIHLSHAQREEVLQGLKKNWAELHHQYQSLSFVIDTMSKKSLKERLELEMKTLEDDIQLFQRFRTIYVPKH